MVTCIGFSELDASVMELNVNELLLFGKIAPLAIALANKSERLGEIVTVVKTRNLKSNEMVIDGMAIKTTNPAMIKVMHIIRPLVHPFLEGIWLFCPFSGLSICANMNGLKLKLIFNLVSVILNTVL